MSVHISPYEIAVAISELADLRDRLGRARYADEPDGVGWEYGVDVSYLRDLVRYWADEFDWNAQQRRLNALPNFFARSDGVSMHFLHAQGVGPAPMPIVLQHGWPSGYLEMTKLMPLLADPAGHGADPADAFHVVVPSLPGFGFSGMQPHGFGYHRAAAFVHELMTSGLGYNSYGLHGTGLGPFVNGWIALEHPDQVVGYHTHDPGLFPLVSFDPPAPAASEAELAHRARSASWGAREGAYGELQRTKPHAIGHALVDSPMGLAAWLVEKHRGWSDSGGDVETRYTKDELCTSFTIYWATKTIASSMRAYYERTHNDPPIPANVRLPVPTGVAMPRYDPSFPSRCLPREMAERTHDIRHWVDLPSGGHFVSWEEPEAVARSIRDFFRPLRAKGSR